MKRALISVSDKTNIVEFASGLIDNGFEIISTGGTYNKLLAAGLNVLSVEDITGFKEILGGRVKTLHPNIHGGILAIRDKEIHREQIQQNDISYIDLVCVNLYPFKETIKKETVTYEEAIENIDIGGPSMLRSAAKNHQYVTVVVDKNDYDIVIKELKQFGKTHETTRKRLAAKAFRHTASYDAVISRFLTEEEFPEQLTLTYSLKQQLRYGENPHQKAAFYNDDDVSSFSIVNAKQLNGKELSYNNIQDANASLQIVREYLEPVVVALKHMNPCGIGTGKDIYEAWQKAYESDTVSIFGGIVATNQVVDEMTAKEMSKIFLELIIAPKFSEEALSILKEKKNLRLLEVKMNYNESIEKKQIVSVNGGLLVQDIDPVIVDLTIDIPTKRKPTDLELEQLEFAWKAVKHVKSNAIVIAKNNQTIGIGAGQMNRVGAAHIAISQAKDNCEGAVMASDAFLPMSDTVSLAVKAGITAIIQPGGSIRDQESIDACDAHGIAMVFTGKRHFKH